MRAWRVCASVCVVVVLSCSQMCSSQALTDAHSVRALMAAYDRGEVGGQAARSRLDERMAEMGITMRRGEDEVCVGPRDLESNFEHRSVTPSAACGRKMFLSEQGLLEEVMWESARGLTKAEELWLSEHALLTTLADA